MHLSKLFKSCLCALSIVLGTTSLSLASDPGESSKQTFNIWDAQMQGVFNMGPGRGNIARASDESLGRDVFRFTYDIPEGSLIGVWTKNYPSELNSQAADTIRLGVYVSGVDQAKQVAVKAEVKGNKGTQNIQIPLHTGWNSIQELVNWSTIGALSEVVFVVSPVSTARPSGKPVWFNPTEAAEEEQAPSNFKGNLLFDVHFQKISLFQKYYGLAKIAFALLFSILLAGLTTFLGKKFKQLRSFQQSEGHTEKDDEFSAEDATALGRYKKDLLYGAATVLMGIVTLSIYRMGMLSLPLNATLGFGFFATLFLSTLSAELLKWAKLKKHLSGLQVFQNMLITGLLAVSSSQVELLETPASWNHLFLLNHLTAAVTFVIYQILNYVSLSSKHKPLKGASAIATVGTPFAFSWLLLLGNLHIPSQIANLLTLGALANFPQASHFIGQCIILFVFNELILNALSQVSKGKWLSGQREHLTTLAVSVAVMLAPRVADWGSASAVASFPFAGQAIISTVTAMLAFAGLWGETYLITGVILDGLRGAAPSGNSILGNSKHGMIKGSIYAGLFMGILYFTQALLKTVPLASIAGSSAVVLGTVAGALLFPFLKTVIESFDGSLPFFERLRYAYKNPVLYIRGLVVGFGFAYMLSGQFIDKDMASRVWMGLFFGVLSSAGISILRDLVFELRGQGKLQSWRLYFTDALLGSFVGASLAFYLDARQVPVIIEKFRLYTSMGFDSKDYITYPLINKWGRIDLGNYSGGSKLLFIESLAGVINWSIAAWLFAVNKVFIQAAFQRETTPIKFFFSKAGFVELMNHMIHVLRWGLWMSPIIFTFLRMMPDPTWYNQDGAIRTMFAIYNNLTLSPEGFQEWSLKLFISLLAFDFLRVLIWMDHMGLRVATLVNLSFIGMDKLDEKVAKFIGPAVTQRYIPEAVKRFTTWAPLLLPFYIPRGQAWDFAWGTASAMRNARQGGSLLAKLDGLALAEQAILAVLVTIALSALCFALRSYLYKQKSKRQTTYKLHNREYSVSIKERGEIFSEVTSRGIDISRRSYDGMSPCGRSLFILDEQEQNAWPVMGNFPQDRFTPSSIEQGEDTLSIINEQSTIKTDVTISLPDEDSAAEIWEITLENRSNQARKLKVAPYLEWVLNGGIHDRFHTQYARLYPEMSYISGANTMLSWNRSTKSMGFIASEQAPQGFLTSRMDFIGRARSVWSPRALKTLKFEAPVDTAAYPTFDPIGALLLETEVAAGEKQTLRLIVGCTQNRDDALSIIDKYLKPQGKSQTAPANQAPKVPLIGHGDIPEGTPQPYWEYLDEGNTLRILTPYTPRPFDHGMSNRLGHSVMVTNRGLHTSCNGNSQQNRLTPDWPDTTTQEQPAEAIYLYDIDQGEWFSPTHHPLNDEQAKNTVDYSVDGSATFHMSKGSLSTELSVFVPKDEPLGVYLLKVKNDSKDIRRMRIGSYFEMALAFQPEHAGPLMKRYDTGLDAMFYKNPRNSFRQGWAFASMSVPSEKVVDRRGQFFGLGRGASNPYILEHGKADETELTDQAQISGLLGTLRIMPGQECTVAIVLGQTDDFDEASKLVEKYKDTDAATASLKETRAWWLEQMTSVRYETNHKEFNHMQNWLKYQTLAERIWARRGFYQTSGAFGFRDQLQDTVNLMWVNPALARKQILLHASHQFVEGDVLHWFFMLTDGRTAFACRSHASDNLLWLVWGTMEYVRCTGDKSILDETRSYMYSEFPFAKLPKGKHGMGHLYHRTTKADSLYKHCLKSIDLVFNERMGENGLPLIGTGDWNDGLDEIGSEGKGESIWLGFFLNYMLKDLIPIIEEREGQAKADAYREKHKALKLSLEKTWRENRYLRAIHDDGTEIGLAGSGVWEIDALSASWCIMGGINEEREEIMFNTALKVLEKEDTILLGWPALREDTKPYLGRSSKYPEGVRENGMYSHGVQWLIRASRVLAERYMAQGDKEKAAKYRETAYRLWLKITPVGHTGPDKIEMYGGQPNKQCADYLTTYDPGRMIWNGYTGAAGWLLRQAIEGVIGAQMVKGKMILPEDMDEPRGTLKVQSFEKKGQQASQGKSESSEKMELASV